jgi:hypothetical protein
MNKRRRFLQAALTLGLGLLAGCAAPSATLTPTAPPASPSPAGPPPSLGSVTADRDTPGRYERIELAVPVTATYENAYNSRQVALGAVFQAPSGAAWEIPGFWDGRDAWRVRFTPSETGTWRYRIQLRDQVGTAESAEGSFSVGDSDRHGWLQVASWRDPALSARYLAYHDGTPFYGVGHCEAFTLGDARMDANGDLNMLKRMREHGENLVVWWPHYNFTFFRDSIRTFDRTDTQLIDAYLASAERLGVAVVYTIWDHNLLRGDGHPWGQGRWNTNGFRTLTPRAEDFFSDPQSWEWQENFYRYLIARWGYSPSIIWMTVSELDGTSAGDQQDAWHARINEFFVRNDPYRHPTTASLSGDKSWPAGFGVTDIPQVHVYAEQKDALKMGDSVARWTSEMWESQTRPNVVGEFGTTNSRIDELLVHTSIWAALASGAAITPLRWSDRGSWHRTSAKIMAQIGYIGRFMADVPFLTIDLKPAQVSVTGANLAALGLSSDEYAIVWVQDRQPGAARADGTLAMSGLSDGPYRARPFDTWAGEWLPELSADASGGALTLALPAFQGDLALTIARA